MNSWPIPYQNSLQNYIINTIYIWPPQSRDPTPIMHEIMFNKSIKFKLLVDFLSTQHFYIYYICIYFMLIFQIWVTVWFVKHSLGNQLKKKKTQLHELNCWLKYCMLNKIKPYYSFSVMKPAMRSRLRELNLLDNRSVTSKKTCSSCLFGSILFIIVLTSISRFF